MGERRGVTGIWWRILREKRPSRRRWEVNIKMDLQKVDVRLHGLDLSGSG
jgi:hypothetical protein